jgi:hypothetical protein
MGESPDLAYPEWIHLTLEEVSYSSTAWVHFVRGIAKYIIRI